MELFPNTLGTYVFKPYITWLPAANWYSSQIDCIFLWQAYVIRLSLKAYRRPARRSFLPAWHETHRKPEHLSFASRNTKIKRIYNFSCIQLQVFCTVAITSVRTTVQSTSLPYDIHDICHGAYREWKLNWLNQPLIIIIFTQHTLVRSKLTTMMHCLRIYTYIFAVYNMVV